MFYYKNKVINSYCKITKDNEYAGLVFKNTQLGRQADMELAFSRWRDTPFNNDIEVDTRKEVLPSG